MSKVKVGIWGLGRAGNGMHVPEINEHKDKFEITAVCDIDADRAKSVGEKVACSWYSDPEKFLAEADMELVVVATYSRDHLPFTRKALEKGFSAIIEKPLALNYESAKELLVLDKKYPGKLFCRQNRRFEPAFQHVKELIDSGIIGEVNTIKLRRNSFSRRNDWQTLKVNGGGQLNNWGPHLIDHALQFTDYKVKSVWGELKRTVAMGDADDSIKILIQDFSGLTVDIEVFGGVALPSNTYEVYGSRGALMVDNAEQDIRMRFVDPSYELKDFPIIQGHPDGFRFADNADIPWIRQTIMVKPSNGIKMSSFYAAICDAMRNGKPFPVTAEQAVEVVRVTQMVKDQNPEFK